jgi:hypothetical protein
MVLSSRFALVVACIACLHAEQAVTNLVRNGGASLSTADWSPFREATIEGEGQAAHFVVRNGASFSQTITLPADAVGRFLAVAARGTSDRVNADYSITGLPYIHGLFGARERGRIAGYMTGDKMSGRPQKPGDWVVMSGVFRVPDDAVAVTIRLGQGERNGDPQNGSAARFDDVGLFLFETEGQARSLVADWPNPAQEYPIRPELPKPVVRSYTDPAPPDEVFWGSTPAGKLPPAVAMSPPVLDPSMRTILPEAEGFVIAKLCSRRHPRAIEAVWTPDAPLVERLDRTLGPLLQGALALNPRPRPSVTNAAQYYRQYVGVVVNGQRLVYINGFISNNRNDPTPPLVWRTRLIDGCDGWELHFGLEFDVLPGLFQNLAFNGGR